MVQCLQVNKNKQHDDSLLGVFVNPLRVEFLATVGKQQQKFLKTLYFISISIVIYSKIDILAGAHRLFFFFSQLE